MVDSAPHDTGQGDVYEFWAACRRDDPVTSIDALGRPLWFATRYEDVERILRDPDRFSSKVNQDTMGPVMGPVILGMDGDEHRRYRSLVAHAFRPSALARWERDLIEPTINGLVDDIARAGRADLVEDVTSRYPVQVIAGIIGIPGAVGDQFHEWAMEISVGPEDYARSTAAARAMREYLEPLVASRRERPTDDLISDIVTAEIDGERLSDDHVFGFLRLLLPAGAETTFRVMGSCLLALLTHADALERAKTDPAFLAGAIEETLRWETSVTMVARNTTCPVEVAGTVIPAGAMVACATGSANRDEARYPNPEEWDVGREQLPHLAFGTGRHQCLGMHLARLELRVGLRVLIERLRGLRLDPESGPVLVEGHAFRSPPRLPVLFDAA